MSTPTPVDPSPAQRADAQVKATARYFTASEHPDVVELRGRIVDLAREIYLRVPPGPQQAIALTELESVQMRANRGIFTPAIPKEQQR